MKRKILMTVHSSDSLGKKNWPSFARLRRYKIYLVDDWPGTIDVRCEQNKCKIKKIKASNASLSKRKRVFYTANCGIS